MIYIYRILQIILSPLLTVYLAGRFIAGKEDKKRFKERLGFASLKKDKSQKLIWIHCASVGESLAVLPIIKRLALTKNTQVLVTTGTVTSAKLMAEKLPKNAFHQYVPLDFRFAVKRFIKNWQPDISVFVESDLWPELLRASSNKVLINARMSDRSFARYSKMKSVANLLLNQFETIFTQSGQDYERFSSLTSANVVNAGNVKYDGPAPEYNKNEYNVLSQAFADKKILVVASTHKGEDECFIEMYKQLKETNKDLLMILFPRHPHRGNEIANLLEESRVSYVQRSKTKGLEKTSTMEVYLADTLGEVGLWYALADVVLIAGCFNWQGQNPLEALKAGKPTYTGPNTQNFKEMTDILTAKKVLFKYANQHSLTNAINFALQDKNLAESFAEKAQTAIDSMTGATETIIKSVRENLKGVDNV